MRFTNLAGRVFVVLAAVILAATVLAAIPAARTAGLHYELGAASPYRKAVVKAALRHGIDPEIIAAVIIKESCVRGKGVRCGYVHPGARGGAGEIGLMQIHPAHFGSIPAHRFADPEFNITFGAEILAERIRLRNGDLFCAASAYNTGKGIWCANARGYATDVLATYHEFRKQRKISLF